MNTINATKTKKTSFERMEKILKAIGKILLYTVGIIAGLILVAIIAKVLEFLFVAAILIIAGCCPRIRW